MTRRLVQWTADALDDWRRLPIDDARAVAQATQRFADTGQGTVIYADGEYLLFVGERVVHMLIHGDDTFVTRVRRA